MGKVPIIKKGGGGAEWEQILDWDYRGSGAVSSYPHTCAYKNVMSIHDQRLKEFNLLAVEITGSRSVTSTGTKLLNLPSLQISRKANYTTASGKNYDALELSSRVYGLIGATITQFVSERVLLPFTVPMFFNTLAPSEVGIYNLFGGNVSISDTTPDINVIWGVSKSESSQSGTWSVDANVKVYGKRV